MTVGEICKSLPPVKSKVVKEMVKFRDFAKEFAGLFGGGGKEKVKELAKFLWRSGSGSGSLTVESK